MADHVSCIFCKIIAKAIPSKIIAETSDVLVIQDIAPKAPVHYLIIPKKHIENMQAVQPADAPMLASLLLMAQQLSDQLPGDKAFRLISNNGATAGQKVFHMHFHFLSGKSLSDF